MSGRSPKDKLGDDLEPDLTKTKEYRRFQKLLKRVIKAPPLRRIKAGGK